jgi:putative DNA primase/helicase
MKTSTHPIADGPRRALSALYALDSGCSRDKWVHILMGAKAAGLSLDDITKWSAAAQNFDSDRDCAQVWQSIKEGSVKAGTLFFMATEAGWKDSGTADQKPYNGRSAPPSFGGCAPQPPPDPDRIASAGTFWDQCLPATEAHPYIIAKRGKPDGLRIVRENVAHDIAGYNVAGWLVVPARSLAGELHTLQLIPPTAAGKKLNFAGAAFAEAMFSIGDAAHSARLYICEGIGQAWACHAATGYAAVVTFGAGRTEAVAKALRQKWPHATLVLVPDRGKESQAQSIAKLVCGSYVELPTDKTENYDANDFAAEYGSDRLAQLLDGAKAPPMRYRLLDGVDLLKKPPLPWMVRGVVPMQGLACIYGQSGSGKSFLSLDLCAAVAGGVDWFGCRVTKAPVVYVALEGEAGFSQRIKAWQVKHRRDVPPALRFLMQPFDLRNEQDLADLAAAVKTSGCTGGLLVIDTLNRAASGADENSSSDMGDLISAATALQVMFGGLVLLVHHSGKDPGKGLRGHSSLTAALDATLEVVRTGDRRSWHIAKSKDDSDSTTHLFRLEVVEIAEHDDGEPITSCVVVQDKVDCEFQRVVPPKAGNQKISYDTLREMSDAADTARPVDAPERLPARSARRAA